MQREADVAALAAEALAAAAAVQRRRLAAAVEQQDGAAALVGEPHEARAQRPGERVEAVAAEVDDLDARQLAADALARAWRAAARAQLSGRGVADAHDEHGALEPRALGGHAAGVVARVVALLVGATRAPRRRRSGRRRGAARRPPSARPRRRATRRRSPPRAPRARSPSEMPECRTATRSPKRAAKRRAVCGESAISGTSTSTLRPARERALGRAQVDLGLARARDAVEQEVAAACLEQLLDAGDGGRLVGRQRSRAAASGRRARSGRAAARRARTSPSSARRRTVAAVVPARATSSASGSGPSASTASSARRRCVAAGAPGRRHPGVARRAHARRKRERERTRRRRAVVGGDPEAQLEHERRDARLLGEPLDDRERALVARRPARLDDDAAHAAARQRNVDDVAALELDALGLQVVERRAQRARRHERDDADGARRDHRRIMAHAPVAIRARE